MSSIAAILLPFGPVAACWETASDSISLQDWIRSKDIVVLSSSDESRNAIEIINQAIFRRAADLVLALPDSTSRRTFFVLDEVSECGKLNGLVSLMKRGRSKGTAVFFAAQSIAGLRAPNMYGPHGTAEIVGQVAHKAFGRLECPETAQWASEVFGDQEIWQTTYSRSQTSGGQNSTSTSGSNDQVVTRRAVIASEFMDIEPCNRADGLSGFYLSPVWGGFKETIPGDELFDRDLIPPSSEVDDFVPREIDAQYLEPWSKKQRKLFSPSPPKKKLKSRPKQEHQVSPNSILEQLDSI